MRLAGPRGSKAGNQRVAAVAAACIAAALLQSLPPRTAAADTTGASVEPTVAAAVAAAKASGSAVEVGAFRGESSETYANGDGSFTRVQHVRPVRTRKAGRWVAVDSTLQRGSDGVVRPVASTVDLRISGGSGPFVQLGRAGRMLSLAWPTPLPEPTLDGDTARFADVLAGVDLLVRADVDGVSHTLVVKTREAAANPALAKLTLRLGGSLSVRDADADGLRAVDTSGGGAVLEAPTPLMWDSTGSAVKTAATTGDGDLAEGPGEGSQVASVAAGVAGSSVTLTPDQGLLTGAGTVFPVYIDPVWKTVQDSAWAMVSSGYPTTSYYKFAGKSTEGVGLCEVAKDSTCVKNQKKRLFFRIPTSAYAGKSILSADFVAYETHAYNCDNPTVVELWHTKGFITSSTWNSTSDNWLDKVDSRDVAHCTKTPVEFNAKSTVADAAAGHWSTTTFGLRAYDETGMAWWKRFADDAYLRVNYNNPPSQPKNADLSLSPGGACVGPSDPLVVNTIAPTMSAELHDPDGDQVAAQFKVGWDDDGDGAITGQWTSATTTMKASGSVFRMAIPTSIGLPQNTLAGWSVRAWDGSDWSPWNYDGSATSCYFTVDTTKPDPPAVTSTDYPSSDPDDPNDPWIDGVGRYGAFTIDSAANDVTKYTYWLNDDAKATANPTTSGGPVTVQAAPTHAGVNYLRVQAFDAAGNGSVIGQYMFRVKAGSAAKAAWALDEPDGSAQVADTSGSYPADVHGGVTLGVDGVSKTAMQLNGTDGYAATAGPVVDTSTSFSVSAWAKLPTEKPDHAAIIATQAGTTRSGFELYYSFSLDRWVFNRYDADSTSATIVRAQSTTAPQGGQWAHLVGVYDAVKQTLTLYVNGTPAATTPYTKPWNATGPAQIGAGWVGHLNSFFSGEIDDVRVFDRTVTGDEVQDLFAQRPVVAARWKLNDDAGTSVPAAAAYYKLDEAAGASRAEDTTGSYPAGVHGGFTFGSAGRFGTAAHLDGGTGYAATTGSVVDTTGSFSVSAWAKLPSTKPSHAGIIATQAGTTRSGFELYYSSAYDRWIFNRYDADTTSATIVRAQSTTVPKPAVWTHLTGVYDATAQQLRLYVNGILEGTAAYTKPWAATGALQLGVGWYGSRSSYFTGDIDDVRVFGQAITGSAAAVLATGSPDEVTADDGPHGHHATMHGSAVIDQSAGWVGDPPGGLVLDGATGYADTTGPVLDTSQSFTVAGWVNSAGVPDHKVAVFSQAGTVNSGFVVRYDPAASGGLGGYQIEMPDADTSGASHPIVDNPNLVFGDWNHVAIVYDAFADEMRLYVNGQLAQIEDQVSYRFNVIGFDATQPFQIGRAKTDSAWGEYWPGVIDDVWAFDGVLTDEQIQNLAAGTEIETTSGP